MSKHLSFELIPNNRKTQTYGVRSKFDNYFLGEVKWKGQWRQYCFFPNTDCVFSKDCLEDVVLLIKELMEKRRSPRNPESLKNYPEGYCVTTITGMKKEQEHQDRGEKLFHELTYDIFKEKKKEGKHGSP